MLNQVVLVGKLKDDPILKETVNGNKVSKVVLEVERSYKNNNGEYEVDDIACTLWKGMAEQLSQHGLKGSLVAIKGRIQTNSYENKEGNRVNFSEIIAEKISFLGPVKEEKN